MEEYEIKRGGEEERKKCKYLGSLIDTEEDLKEGKYWPLLLITS